MGKDSHKKTTTKPWESSFQAEKKTAPKAEEDHQPLSRMANRRKHNEFSFEFKPKQKFPINIILGAIIVVFVGIIGLYAVANMTNSKSSNSSSSSSSVAASSSDATTNSSTSSATSSSSDSTSSASSSDDDNSTSSTSSTSTTSSSTSSTTSSSSSSTSSSSSNSTSSSSSSTSSSSSSSTTKKYTYVVKGQGIYRTAVNNGLTVKEFLALNPSLSYSSTLKAGQKVRIR